MKLIFRSAPKPRGLVAWARGEGDALLDFAGFNALAETMGPAWRDWPEGLRDHDVDEVARGRAQLQERIAFNQWLKCELVRQLGIATAEIDLCTVGPLGFDA